MRRSVGFSAGTQSGVRILRFGRYALRGIRNPRQPGSGMTGPRSAMRRLRASGMAGIAPAFAKTPLLRFRDGEGPTPSDELEKFGRLLEYGADLVARVTFCGVPTLETASSILETDGLSGPFVYRGLPRRLGPSSPEGRGFDFDALLAQLVEQRPAARDTGSVPDPGSLSRRSPGEKAVRARAVGLALVGGPSPPRCIVFREVPRVGRRG